MLIFTQEFQTSELRSATLTSSRGFSRKYKISQKKKEIREFSSRELPCKLSTVLHGKEYTYDCSRDLIRTSRWRCIMTLLVIYLKIWTFWNSTIREMVNDTRLRESDSKSQFCHLRNIFVHTIVGCENSNDDLRDNKYPLIIIGWMRYAAYVRRLRGMKSL